jgi:hypothetical protein
MGYLKRFFNTTFKNRKGCGKTETAVQAAKSPDTNEGIMEINSKPAGPVARLIDEWQDYPLSCCMKELSQAMK